MLRNITSLLIFLLLISVITVVSAKTDQDMIPGMSKTEQKKIDTTDSSSKDEQEKEQLFQFMKESESQPEPDACDVVASVDPKTYTIVPGDKFILSMIRVGHESSTYEMTVMPEGTLILPFLGEVMAEGLNLDAFTKKSLKAYNSKFKGMQVALQLTCLGRYEVMVVGAVNSPGVYLINSRTRLTSVIRKAQGWKPYGSIRNVKVEISGNEFVFDLLKFFNLGDISQNQFILPNSIVNVPAIYGKVEILGEVNAPGIYEIVESDTIDDIIKYAYGFTVKANKENIIVKGYIRSSDGENKYELKQSHFKESVSNRLPALKLSNGDQIIVPSFGDVKGGTIQILGGIKTPGEYDTYDGITIFDLIRMAGGYVGLAAPDKAYLFTTDENKKALLKTIELTSNSDSEQLIIKPGDRIVIPEMTDYVIVTGVVDKPGTYPFMGDYNAMQYASMAGITNDADINKISIRRASGELIQNPDAMVSPGDIVAVYQKNSTRKERKFLVYSNMVTTLFLIHNYINNQ